MKNKNKQFLELEQLVKDIIREADEIKQNTYTDAKETIAIELVAYRLQSKLEYLGYVQLADDTEAV